MLAIGLAACAAARSPGDSTSGGSPGAIGSAPAPLAPPEAARGTVQVRVATPLGANRTTQAKASDVQKVVISLAAFMAPEMVRNLGKADLTAGGASASATFDQVPPGQATVRLNAYDATGVPIGSAQQAVTVVSGQASSVKLAVQLVPTVIYVSPSPTASPVH